MEKHMTVKTFRERLAGYPDDALCCGTFWLAEDFLALDSTLDEETIDAAMELAQEAMMRTSALTGRFCRRLLVN
ncbi:hypothetical protein [Klebsiella aerogenes]|uniref:hypothetical protein n=1 Tax=Klebsiella aerogenes TaxID=548 RepID=UPI00351D2841